MLVHLGGGMKGQGFLSLLAHNRNLFTGIINMIGIILTDTVIKNLPASAGDIRDMGLIPGLGRSPGERSGLLFQHCCLENSMDRGAWLVTVCVVTKSQTRLYD